MPAETGGGKRGGRMIIFCDVENCIYNEYGKCDAGKTEIASGECITFVGKESEGGWEWQNNNN